MESKSELKKLLNIFWIRRVYIFLIVLMFIIMGAVYSLIPKYNVNHIRDIAIFAIIGTIFSIAYVIIADSLNNTVRTVESVERETGLLVLAAIPEYDFEDIEELETEYNFEDMKRNMKDTYELDNIREGVELYNE